MVETGHWVVKLQCYCLGAYCIGYMLPYSGPDFWQMDSRSRRVCAMQALEEEPKSQEVATEDVKGELEQAAAPDGRKMMLDWKGDPMYINPGDKLPF